MKYLFKKRVFWESLCCIFKNVVFYILAELQPKKKIKKVREGTSEYQSAWIIDSEGSDLSEDSEEEHDEEMESNMSEDKSDMDEDANFDDTVCKLKTFSFFIV